MTKRNQTKMKRAALLRQIARTNDPIAAAVQVGMANPAQAVAGLSRDPDALATLVETQRQIITAELTPLAIGRLRDLLTDTRTPGSTLVQAIKIVLDRSLAPADIAATKDLATMTPAELEAARQHLMTELADRAKPVIDATDPGPRP